MGAAFQREDGRVHHCFSPDMEHVDNGFDRVDMNNQFVLMVLRDYLFTGDAGYLKAMWPHVVLAMDSIGALDSDGDGLPDRDTKRNTYDAWNFSGTPTYISILWLAALKAAARIADEMGDAVRAEAWRNTLKTGLASLEKRLWNGEYYDLWLSDTEKDESLMTDQLDGEWFLRAMGMDGNLDDERIRAVVKTILERNFDMDGGLVNASYPEGRRTTLFTHKNCQAEAVWTGIGYLMAALCLSVGLCDDADALVTAIHNNQARFGALWNHWECGHHYTRPLSSWTTLNAALGLRVDSARKTIRLNPIAENITLPLCLPGILGTVVVDNGSVSIHCIEGSLGGWSIVTGSDGRR
nr:glycoside hydrolase family 116 protein [Clostridiales bacterium]